MSVLITGYPGFLATALLPRVVRRTDQDAVCLVQPKYVGMAKQRVAALATRDAELSRRVRIVAGDITEAGLGLGTDALADVTEAWHLAAVYDLAVSLSIADAVNVTGTRNVLRALENCPNLARLHYFSTCYVSGRYAGPFSEDQLEVGAPFNNFYEESKHYAEAEVRRHMSAGMPATIYRPSIVVGDSQTGATQKFDGPYYVMQLLLRQGRHAVLPVVGDPTATRVNIVPRDFVIDAVDHLSGLAASAGRTYHVADPDPLTVEELIDVIGGATGRRVVTVPLPRSVAKGSIRHVPGVLRLMGMPAEAVDYFSHPTHYLTQNLRNDLAGSGIEPPLFDNYVDRLVSFLRDHRTTDMSAMY